MYTVVSYPLGDATDGPDIQVVGPFPTREEAEAYLPRFVTNFIGYHNTEEISEKNIADWFITQRKLGCWQSYNLPEDFAYETGVGIFPLRK